MTAPYVDLPVNGEPTPLPDGRGVGWDITSSTRILFIDDLVGVTRELWGYVDRTVTPAQLETFARLLLNHAAAQRALVVASEVNTPGTPLPGLVPSDATPEQVTTT